MICYSVFLLSQSFKCSVTQLIIYIMLLQHLLIALLNGHDHTDSTCRIPTGLVTLICG